MNSPASNAPERSRSRRAAVTVLACLMVAGACGGDDRRAKAPPVYWANSPPQCKMDETREYYCDSLLPRGAAYDSPSAHRDCPVSLESHIGQLEPVPPVAVFDPSFTEHARRRMPPGNVCCYSWCSQLELVEPNAQIAAESCKSPAAFREQYCFDEPESGTSRPASQSYGRCPGAVVPPEREVFAVPQAALFDEAATSEKRRYGEPRCCYSWCSQAPPASGLQRR